MKVDSVKPGCVEMRANEIETVPAPDCAALTVDAWRPPSAMKIPIVIQDGAVLMKRVLMPVMAMHHALEIKPAVSSRVSAKNRRCVKNTSIAGESVSA